MTFIGVILILSALVGFIVFSFLHPGYGYSTREQHLTLFQYLWIHNWYYVVLASIGILILIIMAFQ
jgi:hypothetical protein